MSKIKIPSFAKAVHKWLADKAVPLEHTTSAYRGEVNPLAEHMAACGIPECRIGRTEAVVGVSRGHSHKNEQAFIQGVQGR